MSELQDLVLDAHGVTRWKSARTIEGYMGTSNNDDFVVGSSAAVA